MFIETEPSKLYNLTEFEALPDERNEYELVKGKVISRSEGKHELHWRVSSCLLIHLGNYVRQIGAGVVYGSKARYVVVPGEYPTICKADVGFISTNRLVRNVFTIPFAPDLAVEVISESNSFSDIEQKVREYFSAGASLVWVIEPGPQLVYVYRVGSNQRLTLDKEAELDGENVVPGFKLKISALFD